MFAEFKEEFMGLVAQATGLVQTEGTEKATLFTSIEAANLSIIEFMNDGLKGNRGRPAPPYAAVQIGALNLDPDWGVSSQTYRAPVTVGIVDATANDATQESVAALLEAIQALIDDPAANFTTFQPCERSSIDVSESNPVFQALGSNSKVDIIAGTITWEPGLLLNSSG
jgi:hypothetical protein